MEKVVGHKWAKSTRLGDSKRDEPLRILLESTISTLGKSNENQRIEKLRSDAKFIY